MTPAGETQWEAQRRFLKEKDDWFSSLSQSEQDRLLKEYDDWWESVGRHSADPFSDSEGDPSPDAIAAAGVRARAKSIQMMKAYYARQAQTEPTRADSAPESSAVPKEGSARTKHTCHATGCDEAIPPSHLMCSKHWKVLSKSLQDEVYRYYRIGQEVDLKPSEDYLQAARKAVDFVHIKEQL